MTPTLPKHMYDERTGHHLFEFDPGRDPIP
jgi:hypothetical protein